MACLKFMLPDDNSVTITCWDKTGSEVRPNQGQIDMLVRYLELMREAVEPAEEDARALLVMGAFGDDELSQEAALTRSEIAAGNCHDYTAEELRLKGKSVSETIEQYRKDNPGVLEAEELQMQAEESAAATNENLEK